jgi:hypothetical protein
VPEFQIEMLWRCDTCRTENGGLKKTCGNCGKPKDKEEDYMSGHEITVDDALTDPDGIRQAKAGPDWTCRYCGSRQRKLDGNCANCTAGQKDSCEGELSKS